MTVEARLADGTVLRFPEGTTDDVIQGAVKRVMAGGGNIAPDKRPFADSSLGKAYYGVTDTLGQGLTLGLADEAAGAGAYVGQGLKNLTYGPNEGEPGYMTAADAYKEATGAQRGSTKEFAAKNPATSTALEVAGGVASAAPARMIANGAQTLARPLLSRLSDAGKNAAVGAGLGGVAGLASGEDAAGRVGGGAAGGIIGGAIGGALPLTAAIARPVLGRVANALGLRNADEAARLQILRAFERDGVTPEQATQRLNDWQMRGAKPEMLFDLGGENVRGLARAAATVPGEAKNAAVGAIAERQAGQSGRIADDLAASFNPNQDYHGTVDALTNARRTAAAPLYERAYSEPVEYSPRLQEFLDQPELKTGLQRGMNMLRREAVARGEPFSPTDYGVSYYPGERGYEIQGVPKLRVLDAAKRGLDDVIEQARDPVTGKIKWTPELRSIDELRAAYVRKLDSLSPDYKAARAAFSGPSQSLDALAMGRSALGKDAEITSKMIADLSPGDKEFFRAGVVRALKDKIDSAPDGADAVKRIFGNAQIRERLRAAFPDDQAFQKFRTAMDREAAMFRNAQFVSPKTNSQTAQRTAELTDMENDPVAGGLIDAVAQSPTLFGATMGAARNILRRGQGMNSATADALSPLLFNPDTAANAGLLGQLGRVRDARIAQIDKNRIRARGLLGGFGAGAGLLTE